MEGFAKPPGSNIFPLLWIYYPQKVAMAPLTHSSLQELLPLKWLSLLPTEGKGQMKPPLRSVPPPLRSVPGLLSPGDEKRENKMIRSVSIFMILVAEQTPVFGLLAQAH